MYKLCKTEQSAQRQRELEQLLLEMMNTCRYEQITVSDFCVQAGIPRKAFYRYFSSRDGALHALIDHTLLAIEPFPSRGSSLSAEVYRREMLRFFRFWQGQKPLLDTLERNALSGVLVTRTIEYALSEYGASRWLLPNREAGLWEHATTFGVCGLMSMVLSWHKSGYAMAPEQMSDIAVDLLTKPLFLTGGDS